jgi:hypothetical protein
MFNIEFKCKVGGKTVSLGAFIAELLAQVIQGVTRELAKQAPVVPQIAVQTMSPPTKAEPLVVSIPRSRAATRSQTFNDSGDAFQTPHSFSTNGSASADSDGSYP